jgi:hypothetical protein
MSVRNVREGSEPHGVASCGVIRRRHATMKAQARPWVPVWRKRVSSFASVCDARSWRGVGWKVADFGNGQGELDLFSLRGSQRWVGQLARTRQAMGERIGIRNSAWLAVELDCTVRGQDGYPNQRGAESSTSC